MRKTAWILSVILIIIHAVLFVWTIRENSFEGKAGRYYLLADDAMISMAYAQNLVHGNGLVWQPGDRVMGITNPGWSLILAVTQLIDLPSHKACLPAIALNGLINLVVILVVLFTAKNRFGLPGTLFSTFAISVSLPLIFWSSNGFETPLQTAFIALALVPFVPGHTKGGNPVLSPVLLAIAAVVRPDAILLFCLLSLALSLPGISYSERFRRRLIPVIAGAIIIAAMFIIQKVYYGEWLPNAFQLKIAGGSRNLLFGLLYVADWLFKDGAWPVVALSIVGLVAWIADNESRRKALTLSAITVIWICYVVWTGGDAFPHARFLLPIIPIISIAAGFGFDYLWHKWFGAIPLKRNANCWQVVRELALVAIILCAVGFAVAPLKTALEGPDPNRVDRVRVAETFASANLPPETKIALFEAGTIPYLLPEFRYLDLLGKNDQYIASTEAKPGLIGHNKWDFGYSLGELKPDIIVGTANYMMFTDESAKKYLDGTKDIERGEALFAAALWIDSIFKKKYRDNRIRIVTSYGTHWTYAREGANIGNLKTFGEYFGRKETQIKRLESE
ncbi:hypothetical protein DRQ36_03085 [bacterium]|nr:MAG: hypothetical protein DRQ36_03085 [bacterium]